MHGSVHGKSVAGRRHGPRPRAVNDVNTEKHGFIQLHVISKNVQSIRDAGRFADFCAELADVHFDLVCLSETWRSEQSEVFQTLHGHCVYLNGSEHGRRVGVVVHRKNHAQLKQVIFQPYSSRVCVLQFGLGDKKFRAFSCYFPTAWDGDDAVLQTYELVSILLDNCVLEGCIPILGGDFNACLGAPLVGDELDFLGACGEGPRTERGHVFARWVMQHGLQICNRLRPVEHANDS